MSGTLRPFLLPSLYETTKTDTAGANIKSFSIHVPAWQPTIEWLLSLIPRGKILMQLLKKKKNYRHSIKNELNGKNCILPLHPKANTMRNKWLRGTVEGRSVAPGALHSSFSGLAACPQNGRHLTAQPSATKHYFHGWQPWYRGSFEESCLRSIDEVGGEGGGGKMKELKAEEEEGEARWKRYRQQSL